MTLQFKKGIITSRNNIFGSSILSYFLLIFKYFGLSLYNITISLTLRQIEIDVILRQICSLNLRRSIVLNQTWHRCLLICATKKGSEVLSIPNIVTGLIGVSDHFFDFERSAVSSSVPVCKDAVELIVLYI